MAALFERKTGNITSSMAVPRTLELRQIPFLDTVDFSSYVETTWAAAGILSTLFTNLSTNWMYSAIFQLSLNGSEPSWSQDGWNFVPLSFSHIQNASSVQNAGNTANSYGSVLSVSAVNISFTTPAVRGRLQCSQHVGLDNSSKWLSVSDLDNSTVWNITANPKNFTSGYQLGIDTGDLSGDANAGFMLFPNSSDSSLTNSLFNTSAFVNPSLITCCANGTDRSPQPVALGFWSPNNPAQEPFASFPWPINFTVKWIFGRATVLYLNQTEMLATNSQTDHRLVFAEIPRIQAINCQPAIESAMADVTVDTSGRVQKYTILEDPEPEGNAWSDSFLFHNLSKGSPLYDLGLENMSPYDASDPPINVTTR